MAQEIIISERLFRNGRSYVCVICPAFFSIGLYQSKTWSSLDDGRKVERDGSLLMFDLYIPSGVANDE